MTAWVSGSQSLAYHLGMSSDKTPLGFFHKALKSTNTDLVTVGTRGKDPNADKGRQQDEISSDI